MPTTSMPIDDLFEHQPKPKLTKREARRRKEEHRMRVMDWAHDVLLREVLPSKPDVTPEDIINVDGSGPPSGWRGRLSTCLQEASGRRMEKPSDVDLIRLATRIGWVPRAILAAMPSR